MWIFCVAKYDVRDFLSLIVNVCPWESRQTSVVHRSVIMGTRSRISFFNKRPRFQGTAKNILVPPMYVGKKNEKGVWFCVPNHRTAADGPICFPKLKIINTLMEEQLVRR